ncbi:CesT family type III secretion system chaperone [Apirhabdus apintestini]|uniref:CesT family type III secretion system chaperone n=1 Tax=Erwinia sp. HR93 TaxID=3094840 RepID=UPI002ADED4AD|nr:CesT family type III secretion system chaperone [Erwinia sp. HR93]MEA1063773.1 CesT family type III secretion system chaperone [Erwinia sp. HR93]WPM84160.1 CesT family type III secretion system chaperone [Enterobacteriaceae bacterium CA-0114]
MTNDEIISQLGDIAGIKHLAFDLQRVCNLTINSDYHITLAELDEDNLIVHGVICQLAPEVAANASLTLLSANMMFATVNGPYVSWSAENTALYLTLPLQRETLDAHALYEQIHYLIQNIEHLRETLHQQSII